MFGPSIPKELRERREKKRKLESHHDASDSESDLDDFIGPVLIQSKPEKLPSKPEPETDTEKPTEPTRPSLLELHQQKTSGSTNPNPQYDSTKALNDEVKEELLRKLNANGGLSGRFTSGK